MLLKKTNSSDSLKQPSINSEENNDLTGKLTQLETTTFKMQTLTLYEYDRTGTMLEFRDNLYDLIILTHTSSTQIVACRAASFAAKRKILSNLSKNKCPSQSVR